MDIKECYSWGDVANKLFGYNNGRSIKKAKEYVRENGIDISHFDSKIKNRKYKLITKKCPVCNKEFETKLGHRDEKTTCSHSCSNSYFRSGDKNGNWSEDRYRTTCFLSHKKECVVCGENKIVEVHHLDGNRSNNKPNNLIPLCPTHHQYWHSSYKSEVEDKIYEYVNIFKENYENEN